MFFRGSRYESVADTELTTSDGRVVRYKRVRFIPETTGIVSHIVMEGDRLDLIAYQVYRDPEQYWRICDANQALRPDDLVDEPGRRLRLPIPMG